MRGWSLEVLVFARVLGESGGYIKENAPVLATGRLSVRDEKAPQMLVDSIRPLGEAGTALGLARVLPGGER